jgi:hypothetical protein
MRDTSQHICGENGTQFVPFWHLLLGEWYSPSQMQYNSTHDAVTPGEWDHETLPVTTSPRGSASHQCPSGRKYLDHGHHR